MMNGTDPYSGPVPALLLTVGCFLLAESLTFTALALNSHGIYRVDFIDFAFVFAGALFVTTIGVTEGRRLHSRPPVLYSASLLGVILGIAGGFIAIWLFGLGH
jgi:hypothetical protein